MRDELKCGRKLYPLIGGDVVMDNGSVYQLITRATKSNGSPEMSKCEFDRFKAFENVGEVKDHNYIDGITLWRYG